MHDIKRAYWEILNDLEDLAHGGVRREHSALAISESPQATAATSSRMDVLETIAQSVRECTKCALCEHRTNTVPGVGGLDPLVMFIGEGPGAEEDKSGVPFVGRAGQYLDKWLSAIGLSREDHCFIGNIVKCRPPGNRDPEPDEMSSCLPFLHRQIDTIQPKAIVTLGRISSQVLCKSTMGIGKLRGGNYDYLGIPIIPTYHPSGVLRNPEYRSAVWEDLKTLQNIIKRQ